MSTFRSLSKYEDLTSGNSEKSRRILFFFLLLFYKIALEVVYLKVVSPAYSYMFLTTNINLFKCLLSLLLFLIVSLLLVLEKDCVSKNIIITLCLFIYYPTLSYYWLNNQDTLYIIFLTISFVVILLFSKFRFKTHLKQQIVITNNTLISICFAIFVIVLTFLVYLRGGIDLRALNFKSIYSLREEENITGFAGYLKNWIPKVFFPLLFGYFVVKKKWIWAVSTIGFEILLYMAFGNKAFLLCVGWAVVCLLASNKRYFPIWITLAMVVIVSFSGLLSYFRINDSFRDAIPFRLLFVPSQIQYQYYDYFSVNEKMFYSESWIGKLFGIENRFGEDVAFAIHRINYPNGGLSHSNTCFLGDAYYNLGFFGMILVSCFSGLLFSLYNRFKKVPPTLVFVSVSYIIFSFADTGLQTTLITGGMLINLFLLYSLNSASSFYVSENRFVCQVSER